jgi:kynureninase
LIKDNLHKYRAEFHFPKVNNKLLYRNSLGLQQNVPKHIDEVMDDWANLAVEGHFMLINLGGIS